MVAIHPNHRVVTMRMALALKDMDKCPEVQGVTDGNRIPGLTGVILHPPVVTTLQGIGNITEDILLDRKQLILFR